MPLRDEQVDLIAAAMLAANNFPLLRSQNVVAMLRKARLLDPAHVATLDLGPLTVKLAEAGYDRGTLTSVFAGRLKSLMQSVADGTLDGITDAVERGDEGLATRLLTCVKGIGPSVAHTAWTLLRTVAQTRSG